MARVNNYMRKGGYTATYCTANIGGEIITQSVHRWAKKYSSGSETFKKMMRHFECQPDDVQKVTNWYEAGRPDVGIKKAESKSQRARNLYDKLNCPVQYRAFVFNATELQPRREEHCR